MAAQIFEYQFSDQRFNVILSILLGVKIFRYLSKVQNYFNVLLDVIKPMLYKNGGPILMVQVENEYGNTGICNEPYKLFLRDLIWSKLGNDTVLYISKSYEIVCAP